MTALDPAQEIMTGDDGLRVVKTMVVGLDGSAGSIRALAWAVANAPGAGSIQPAICWHYPWWAMSPPMAGSPSPPPDEWFKNEALDAANKAMAPHDPSLFLDPIVGKGRPGQTLVAIAQRADLLVVGTRGRAALTGSILGSVSSHCVAHSKVPVAVIPEDTDVSQPVRKVVVGVDGSANAVAALSWSLRNVPEHATIEVVHAWSPPAVDYDFGPMIDRLEAGALAVLQNTVKLAREQNPSVDRVLLQRSEFGDPRTVLRDADADVVIIGTRGHRGIAHLLLGSTASAMTHHPVVPTIAVPG